MRLRNALTAFCALVSMAAAYGDSPQQNSWSLLVDPQNAYKVHLLDSKGKVGVIGHCTWGPNWSWANVSKKATGDASSLAFTSTIDYDKKAGKSIEVTVKMENASPNAIRYSYTLKADQDVPLMQFSAGISFTGRAVPGKVETVLSDGKPGLGYPLPTPLSKAPGEVSKVIFKLATNEEVSFSVKPAATLHVENGDLRIQIAKDLFKKGTANFEMTVTFTSPAKLVASPEGLAAYIKTPIDETWFPFNPANDNSPGAIGMQSWLDKPAGTHGFMKVSGERFVFDDNTPVKLWGTNLSYITCAPDKLHAEKTAERFAKYGINCVRLHKFTNWGWEGIGDPNDSLKFDQKKLNDFDYFAAKLKEQGVYYSWSHSFGWKIRKGDKDKLLNYDEIANNIKSDTYSIINVAPDLQDLMIKMVLELLNHKNPHTGLAYVQDPALAYIELQNEDDVFFYTLNDRLPKCPAYKKALEKRYAVWLKKRYGGSEGLAKAWGKSLKQSDNIEDSIELIYNPWFLSDDSLGKQSNQFERQRLLDCAAFLHEEQNAFYTKFIKALRDAGFKGAICGSPWYAPSTLPQMLNLKSDAACGFVDRHNYFGKGVSMTMLSAPGSGYLNTGLYQVAGRPFSLSEWIHVYPSYYAAEGPAIMAAYGMGLQGWDASFEFQSMSNGKGFLENAGGFPWNIWNVDLPNQIGQYPTLARMIYRGDVKEGDVIAVRRVSPENLSTGKFDFSEKAVASGDIKTFTSSVPQEALAAGRVLVEFTDKATPSSFPDMSKFTSGKTITSSTKQLVWKYEDKGYFTVNTPGTVGVCGFAQGVPFSFSGIDLSLESHYASFFVTAAEKDRNLSDCKQALVSLVARQSNTGFKILEIDESVTDNGSSPVMVEGVKAKLKFSGRKVAAVNLLDVDGRRQPGKTLPIAADGSISLDTGRDKTLYYEIAFK